MGCEGEYNISKTVLNTEIRCMVNEDTVSLLIYNTVNQKKGVYVISNKIIANNIRDARPDAAVPYLLGWLANIINKKQLRKSGYHKKGIKYSIGIT